MRWPAGANAPLPLLLLVLSAPVAGCPVSSPLPPRPPPRPRGIVDARPGPRATPIATLCGADRPELCNGLDDDCDGALDEGCPSGAEDPVLHVTVAWSGPASVGLRIQAAVSEDQVRRAEAAGASLEPQVVDAAAMGCADVDGRPPVRVSSLWFDEAHTPRGTWAVAVSHRDGCEDPAAPVPVSVTVAGPSQVAGTWNTTLTPGAVEDVVTFSLR